MEVMELHVLIAALSSVTILRVEASLWPGYACSGKELSCGDARPTPGWLHPSSNRRSNGYSYACIDLVLGTMRTGVVFVSYQHHLCIENMDIQKSKCRRWV